MALNETAFLKLRGLRRGQTLPWSSSKRYRRCSLCDHGYSRPRLTCPGCGQNDGDWPVRCCRLCEQPVPKGRISWCGEECVDAYSMLTSSSYLRSKVHERDHGVCAACHLDCDAVKDRLRRFDSEQRRQASAAMEEMGFDWSHGYGGRVTLWDADHVDPLDEGGNGWELSNVQTLCQPCHKAKTAEQAARRGKQRRLVSRKDLRTRRTMRELGLS